ncbi:hypothetical protein HQ36_06765 [Porphyromonas gingivicanis]|uniref:Uncharacterized protein n=1 Tax=Porphyromonas gingivicanis TaxID=266762 RepID=A0A0A2G2R8_9PORP|nr:hypothetical protein HQ36_06765 [Porphyromonas gingivicanis]
MVRSNPVSRSFHNSQCGFYLSSLLFLFLIFLVYFPPAVRSHLFFSVEFSFMYTLYHSTNGHSSRFVGLSWHFLTVDFRLCYLSIKKHTLGREYAFYYSETFFCLI